MCERGWLDVVTALLQRCQITMSLRRYRNAEAISSTAVPSTWWDGRTCTFVGRRQVQRITDERVPNADLYQLLAYATALARDRRLDDTAWRPVITARSSLRGSGRT